MKEEIVRLLDKLSDKDLRGVLLFLRALLRKDGEEEA